MRLERRGAIALSQCHQGGGRHGERGEHRPTNNAKSTAARPRHREKGAAAEDQDHSVESRAYGHSIVEPSEQRPTMAYVQ